MDEGKLGERPLAPAEMGGKTDTKNGYTIYKSYPRAQQHALDHRIASCLYLP